MNFGSDDSTISDEQITERLSAALGIESGEPLSNSERFDQMDKEAFHEFLADVLAPLLVHEDDVEVTAGGQLTVSREHGELTGNTIPLGLADLDEDGQLTAEAIGQLNGASEGSITAESRTPPGLDTDSDDADDVPLGLADLDEHLEHEKLVEAMKSAFKRAETDSDEQKGEE